ncbi:MAG: hypothetical protein JXA54_14770 [Candidatus Heimdallarchaeota archaeon]|nr:hypothetical protein [Candidatus Heimdallarchaeota archaeon]
MPEEITIQIPNKLAEFIDKLTKEGFYTNREDFARCSLEIIAQLYGLSTATKGGKSLLEIFSDNKIVQPEIKPETVPNKNNHPENKSTINSTIDLSQTEFEILDLFIGTTFEYEDALYARFTMELMKLAKTPIPKEKFLSMLNNLANKGKIERTEHNNKIIWKIIDKYG